MLKIGIITQSPEVQINLDRDLYIKWPIKNPIISKKDSHNQTFSDFTKRAL